MPDQYAKLNSLVSVPRCACAVQMEEDLALRLVRQREGRQQIYTFDGPNGVTLDFCLYLPMGFSYSTTPWPLLIFLHAMHARFDSDVNLLFESEAPPQLLLQGSYTSFKIRHRVASVNCQIGVR